MAAVWLLGLAPAVFLPGALNRFVFIKLALAMVAIACALMAELPGRLQRRSRILLILGGITLASSACLGQAPLAQLMGRAPRYEGLVTLSVYLGAFLMGAWLLGPGANPVLRAHLVRATAVAASMIAFVAVLEAVGLHPLATSASRAGSLLGNATEQGAYGAGVVGLCLHAITRGTDGRSAPWSPAACSWLPQRPGALCWAWSPRWLSPSSLGPPRCDESHCLLWPLAPSRPWLCP